MPPRAPPLVGVPTTMRLPSGALGPGYQLVRFRWQYRDPAFSTKGDGAARVAPPDSARLDFVVSGPLGGSGYALLFDDRLVAPGGGGARRYLPATPLVWATLGRLAIPAGADTVVRVDGDTLWADIGPGEKPPHDSASAANRGVGGGGGGGGGKPLGTGGGPHAGCTWRVAFVDGQLVSLARLAGGRIRETVVRDPGRGRIRYENAGARRSLTLTQVRSEAVPAFDPGVWHP